jgi:RNA polymerase sigma factor (sigma-70 family)
MTPVFSTLLQDSSRRVHRAALGFLGEREIAREAAQEALMKAYAARARYDTSQPFYPWMYRIVKNTCLDILAKRRRRPRAALDVERLADRHPSPLDSAQQAEEHTRLWAAMERLSEPHREVINLRHFQDLSYGEIAEVLGIAEGTVMSRLFRARSALAAAMREGT